MNKTLFLLISFLICFWTIHANPKVESEKFPAVNGYIKDATNGETLIGAAIYIEGKTKGTITNVYGFYSFPLQPGTYNLVFSYIGYRSEVKTVVISSDVTLNVELFPETVSLKEVVIATDKPNANISRNEMSVEKLDMKRIARIPALMGEIDLIKAIQMLPGVQTTAEGSSGFSVRGGTADQNMIQLDEATVYNASHLMGFFSVFNNDAVRDVKLYKGDIPAWSGGRLASLLDVRMKDGNAHRFEGAGGIGTISSRLTLEGPIGSENTTFMVSGRRTYADMFLPLSSNEAVRDNRLFFYDLNLKMKHTFNEKNRIFLSGYFGRDVFKNEFSGFGFGNQMFTLRWNHVFNPRLFLNTSVVFSRYDYSLGSPEGRTNSFEWTSDMKDFTTKLDFTYFYSPSNSLRFGLQTIYHDFNPGLARGVGENSAFNEFKVPDNQALEHGVYLQHELEPFRGLTLKYGMRLSVFQNMGKAEVLQLDDNYEVIGKKQYGKGELINTYVNAEPRVGATFMINEQNSVKASYSRTVQYVQQASNSQAGTPLDIWFPASPNVKPQKADQWALGFFRNFMDNSIEASVEGYYKNMWNVVDFKEFASILLNDELEAELRTGTAESFGVEWMARITRPQWGGWVSYTWSRSFRTVAGVNDNQRYPAPFDKPHNVSMVLSYDPSPKVTFSANWLYAIGNPATYPTGRMEIMGNVIPVVSERNGYRFPDYHRLDLAVTWRPSKHPSRRWNSEWNFSVYNAYARKNAWAVNFVQDKDNPNMTYAEKTYLFGIVPSVTYNFKF